MSLSGLNMNRPSGNVWRGKRKDKAAHDALVKRQQARKAIELARELDNLIKEITEGK